VGWVPVHLPSSSNFVIELSAGSLCNYEGALWAVPLKDLTAKRKDEELVVCRAGRASDQKLIQQLQKELTERRRPAKSKAPTRDFSARVQNTPLAIRKARHRERYTEVLSP
jgi:hypothetical protein